MTRVAANNKDALEEALDQMGQPPSAGKKVTWYYPPSGWKYGFPKRYEPLTPDEVLDDTLSRDGYPDHELNAGMAKYCRFWEEEE